MRKIYKRLCNVNGMFMEKQEQEDQKGCGGGGEEEEICCLNFIMLAFMLYILFFLPKCTDVYCILNCATASNERSYIFKCTILTVA